VLLSRHRPFVGISGEKHLMADVNTLDRLIAELQAEWLRLFEAIEEARHNPHLHVSEATVTWDVLKESVELRDGGALDEARINALRSACVRMRDDLLRVPTRRDPRKLRYEL
jgi:hypothetical protein